RGAGRMAAGFPAVARQRTHRTLAQLLARTLHNREAGHRRPGASHVMDLATSYLGLMLPHPFLPGASPLTQDLDTALRLQDAGAPAFVMHSLFEEDLVEQGVEPHGYLEQLLRIKRRTGLPVIASLNGTTADGWLRYAAPLEQAGA